MRLAWMVCLGPLLVAPGSAREVLPVERFLTPPRLQTVVLAPAGDQVVALSQEESGATVWWLDPATDRRHQVAVSRQVTGIEWFSDGSGLLLRAGDRLAVLSVDADSPSGFTRPRSFFRLEPRLHHQFAGVDPTRPRAIWVREKAVTAQGEARYRLLRVTPEAPVEVLVDQAEPVGPVALDAAGRVAFLQRTEITNGEPVGLRIDRVTPTGLMAVVHCDLLDTCVPVGQDSFGRLLVVSRFEEDRMQLWALTWQGPGAGLREVLASDPEHLADLADVKLDPRTGAARLVAYDTDRRREYGLAADVERHLSQLRRRFPQSNLAAQAPAGARFWVLEESSPRLHHPRYHLYEPARQVLSPLLEDLRQSRPQLPPERLSTPRHVTYRASDGAAVFGFVHLPPGADPRSAPLVVRVHGGPWNHARFGYSAVTQLLVDRGFVVFEPNFRASTGYGWAHTAAARGDFGNGRVQQDILDGVDFLLAQGIGDPDRLVILGHSFGGFSTLGALAFTPRRFRVGIASAPPIDLARTLLELDPEKRLPNGISQKQLVEKLVGFDDPRVVADLRRNSPEAHLAATERPLLIFAGGEDDRVDVVDVRHYAQELARRGKDVTLVVDERAGHSFETRLAQRAYLDLVERFLAHHIGTPASPPPPDPELAAYFSATLELGAVPSPGAVSGPGPP